MDTDLDTLATALYVRVDDALKDHPELAPARPAVGIAPKLSDAELVTLAVLQALLGFTSETHWLRHVDRHLRSMFPYVPGQAGYNKRLRAASGLLRALIRVLATECSSWADDLWLIDSTPVECGRSRPTAQRSALGGLGGLRVLRQPLPVLLGPASAPGVHPVGPAGLVCVDQPQGRRTRGRPRPVRDRTRSPGPPGRTDDRGRQGLRQPRVRDLPQRARRQPPATRVQTGQATSRRRGCSSHSARSSSRSTTP